MQKYQDSVVSTAGRAITSATVLVKTLAGATATIYSDNGVTTQANPLSVGTDGEYSFYAANGRYTLTITASGYEIETRSDIVLFDPATDPGDGGFWPDVDSTATILRLRDRVFIGDAAEVAGNRYGAQGGAYSTTQWPGIPGSTGGLSWVVRDTTLLAIASTGLMAITGIARNSDQESAAPSESIGVSGFSVNDSTGGTGWALYGQYIRYSGAGFTTALEAACQNRGTNTTAHPYQLTAGAHGLWLVANGDISDGDVNADTAIVVTRKSTTDFCTWNKGIVFRSDSLTGNDGSTGVSTAIQMGRGMRLHWLMPSADSAASIRSDASTPGKDVGLLFDDDSVILTASTGLSMATFSHVASAVNRLVFKDAAAGGALTFGASGSDTDIGISYLAKGAGLHRFYSHGGTNEEFRVGGVASSPVNFLHAYGGNTGSPAAIVASGTDTNIDVGIKGKGSSGVKLIDGGGSSKVAVNTTGIGFFAVTPIAQPTTGSADATFVANAGTAVNDASTFDGYTLKQVVKALRGFGLLT